MFEKIIEASSRIKKHAHRTPIQTSSSLNEICGSEIYLKCENFQRVGAFKFRGAFNAISLLSDEEKNKGVITYSSGNHAQAVALVGKLLNIKTLVVMPSTAPKIKSEAAKDFGAEIVEYDPETETREIVTEEIQKKNNYILIPPFDHPDVIAGQGTTAYEFLEAVPDLDYLLTPCGGGGLLSGSAIVAKNLSKKCIVIGVEPELANDAAKSFHTKVLHSVKNPRTIADGTRTASLGKHTFPLILKYVDDIVTLSEKEIIDAVKFLFFRLKIVVEPSGALGVAAVLNNKAKVKGKIGIILSGGNIDADTMKFILSN